MPIQLGGPSLPKLKQVKKPAYNPWAYVPGGSSPAVSQAIQTQGYKPFQAVTIPKANSVVAPQTFTSTPAYNTTTGAGAGTGQDIEALKAAIRNDPMYSIGESNWKNALTMGERQYMADPFKQAYMNYGFDIPAWNKAHPGAVSEDILTAAQKYLDPAATAAMSKDPNTIAHQLQHNFGAAIAGIGGNQAARGMLGSGGADVASSKASYQLALNERNAMNEFLGSLGTANQNWLGYQNQQNEIWRAAQEAITSRVAQQPGASGTAADRGPYEGHTADIPTDDPLYTDDPGAYPHLNPEVPEQIYTPVTVGSSTSLEPKPIAGNYIPAVSPATAKAIAKAKKTTQPSPMARALNNVGRIGP
jgi:hypothetical protein